MFVTTTCVRLARKGRAPRGVPNALRRRAVLSMPASWPTVDPCACKASLLEPTDLPVLKARGLQPSWDKYLERVYGPNVLYPVRTRDFHWFYRCSCQVTQDQCGIGTVCSNSSSNDGTLQRNCMPIQAPLGLASGRTIVPRVWMSNLDGPVCRAPFREAFVGLRLADHVKRERSWRGWPNPENHLSPYGLWLYPRPLPTCLSKETWVEVIRIREGYEASSNFTWYYHAPGSGIWLNTGRTVCVANVQRDSREMFVGQKAHEATSSGLASNGFPAGTGIDQRLRRGRTQGLDTLQRNGPFGNMLEIVDVRPEAAQRCGRAGCTCTGTLRAGWNASEPCQCSEASTLLNCGRYSPVGV